MIGGPGFQLGICMSTIQFRLFYSCSKVKTKAVFQSDTSLRSIVSDKCGVNPRVPKLRARCKKGLAAPLPLQFIIWIRRVVWIWR
jgi:hypothetical protein